MSMRSIKLLSRPATKSLSAKSPKCITARQASRKASSPPNTSKIEALEGIREESESGSDMWIV